MVATVGKRWVVYNCFFCGNSSGKVTPMWRHSASSLKEKDVGYCRKLSGVRGSVLLAKRKDWSWKTKVNIEGFQVNNNKCSLNTGKNTYTLKYTAFVFVNSKPFNVHLRFPGLILSYLTPFLSANKTLPLTLESFPSNPHPSFSHYMRNDITSVWLCLTTFCKKTIVYY